MGLPVSPGFTLRDLGHNFLREGVSEKKWPQPASFRTHEQLWGFLESFRESKTIDKISIDLLSDPRITNPPRSPTVSLHKGEEERLRRVRPVARMA